MVEFNTILLKYGEMGDKTGWTFIEIGAEEAAILKPGNKKSFRVRGTLDKHPIKQVAVMPMGDGKFILAVNAEMRKGIGKRGGATVHVKLELDDSPLLPSAELMECLDDDPKAKAFFDQLTPSNRNYFTKWIESAKTDETKTKRIVQTLQALAKKQNYPMMLRAQKEL